MWEKGSKAYEKRGKETEKTKEEVTNEAYIA